MLIEIVKFLQGYELRHFGLKYKYRDGTIYVRDYFGPWEACGQQSLEWMSSRIDVLSLSLHIPEHESKVYVE